MRRIICDRCQADCGGFHASLSLNVVHATKLGEELGEDDYQNLDLCRQCCDEARQAYGFKVRDRYTADAGYTLRDAEIAVTEAARPHP